MEKALWQIVAKRKDNVMNPLINSLHVTRYCVYIRRMQSGLLIKYYRNHNCNVIWFAKRKNKIDQHYQFVRIFKYKC